MRSADSLVKPDTLLAKAGGCLTQRTYQIDSTPAVEVWLDCGGQQAEWVVYTTPHTIYSKCGHPPQTEWWVFHAQP